MEFISSQDGPVEDHRDRHAIVVTGMHRSGTSALSRAFSSLGYAQPHDLMAPQSDNPDGFWESRSLVDLNDEMLGSLGLSWDSPALPTVQGCTIDESAVLIDRYLQRMFGQRAVEALGRSYQYQPEIVLKDPRMCLLGSFWSGVLQAAGYRTSYLHIFRNPLEVSRSLKARNGLDEWKAHALWLRYNLAALSHAQVTRLTPFDQLLTDAPAIVEALARELGCRCLELSPEERGFLRGFISEQRMHHRFDTGSVDNHALAPQIVKTLYAKLLSWSGGGTPNAAEVQALSRELDQHLLFCGQTSNVAGIRRIHDPDVHLIVDGRRLTPKRQDDDHVFNLPAAADQIHLMSEAGLPLTAGDERRLGIAVTRLELDGLDILADDDILTPAHGWHQKEALWRWTDGRAQLPSGSSVVTVKFASFPEFVIS